MTTAIEYALMAGASYYDTRAEINRFVLPQNWNVYSRFPADAASGFEAATYKNGTDFVISFAGTAGGGDWLHGNIPLALGRLPDQLRQAADYYLQVKASAPVGTSISFTGHSLGGGLASLMAVMFGESAFTFDQAPFRSAALMYSTTEPITGSVTTHSVAQDLLAYLQGETINGQPKYSTSQLNGLTNFKNALNNAAPGVVPNEGNVTDINVAGEILAFLPFSRIGAQANIPQQNNMAPVVGQVNLHSQALLAAFLQSNQTADANKGLSDATFKLNDLLKMIFDPKLFSNDPNNLAPDAPENFLERLVKHQTTVIDPASGATDAMVTRFTRDLWKLAQNDGLTMSDGNTTNPDLHQLSNALIAFAMQKYYDEKTGSVGEKQELFNYIAGETGSLRFDMAAISKEFKAAFDAHEKIDLSKAKGFEQYFKDYLKQTATTSDEERGLINSLLPWLRDWYVQAGTDGLIATDALNRGAFMLGGKGSDALTGGNSADLLVGNAGDDLLIGGKGNDILLGGTGDDNYVYTSGDGLDTILDSGGQGRIAMDGSILGGGAQYGDSRVYRDTDQHLYVQVDEKTLIVDGNIIINNYSTGALGLNMGDALPDPANPVATTTLNGDLAPILLEGNQVSIDTWGNVVVSGVAQPDRADELYLHEGNNHVISGGGDDVIQAPYTGDDLIEAGSGRDYVQANIGDDVVLGGADGDILYGGLGDDRLYADTQISVAQAITNGNNHQDIATRGDWLTGGPGQDVLIGSDARDVLAGGGGADLLIGGAGDDDFLGDLDYLASDLDWVVTDQPDGHRLFSSSWDAQPSAGGADVIYAGLGNDYVWAGAGNDVVFGEANDDRLYGNEGNDILLGGAGKDKLWGGTESDYLDGGDDADELYGNENDDILIGGKGDDTLWGQEGQDTYIYNVDDGVDTIYDTRADNNIIRFGAGVDKNNIKLHLGSLLLDLGNGDAVHIGNFDQTDVFNSSSISGFEFADGSTLTTTELLARGFDLDGTADDDIIVGTNTTDRINGFAGDDILLGMNGNDILLGSDGNDQLYGDAGDPDSLPLEEQGDDLLDGGAGDDDLGGAGGHDTLLGGEGNDLLDGGEGNDLITGGAGSDILVGGAGDDTYIFRSGDGVMADDGTVETVYEEDGQDTVRFDGVNADSLQVSANDESVLRIEYGASDALEIEGGVGGVIENFEVEGETLTTSQFIGRYAETAMRGVDANGHDVVSGGRGNDALLASYAYTTLSGGLGDDTLSGSGGNNTYLYNTGDGLDTIVDSSAQYNHFGANTLRFGAGISVDSLRLSGENDALVIKIGEGDESEVRIENFGFANPESNTVIHNFVLADGTVLDRKGLLAWGIDLFGGSGSDALSGAAGNDQLAGAAGNDSLYGLAGNDVLNGGSGNDRLEGGDGDDTYLFALGDGADVVVEGNGTDTLRLGDGIAFEQMTVRHFQATDGGRYLDLDFGSGDRVSIRDGALGKVDRVVFADGRELGWQELVAMLPSLNAVGTDEADTMIGTMGNDTLDGGSGDDIINAGVGDDELIGGDGNDILSGGIGRDTYHFGFGTGIDTIVETASEQNLLVFDPGLLPIYLQLTRDGDDLLVGLKGQSDSVRLSAYYADSQDWRFRFGDGAEIDMDALASQMEPDTGSVEGLRNTYKQGILADFAAMQVADGYTRGSNGKYHQTHQWTTSEQDRASEVVFTSAVTGWSWLFNSTQETVQKFIGSVQSDGGMASASPYQAARFISAQNGSGQRTEGSITGLTASYDYRGTLLGYWVHSSAAGASEAGGSISAYRVTHESYNLQIPDVLRAADDFSSLRVDYRPAFSYYGNVDYDQSQTSGALVDGGAAGSFIEAASDDDALISARGAFLYGNDGDDAIYGGDADDILIGGRGFDDLHGGNGGDTYHLLEEDSGDYISDTGNDFERYRRWYCAQRGIKNFDLSEEYGGMWVINGTGDGFWSAPSYEELLEQANDASQQAFFMAHAEYVPPLPEILRIAGNDYPAMEILYGTGALREDRLVFGEGITPDNLLVMGSEDPEVAGELWFSGPTGTLARVALPETGDEAFGTGVELYEFADGKVLTLRQMVERMRADHDVQGTAADETFVFDRGNDRVAAGDGADSLFGGAGNDILDGGAGDDYLVGGEGDDVLEGGRGDDYLLGASGNDSYTFDAGFGNDTIEENDATVGNMDRIVFGAGIEPAQVGASRDEMDLVLSEVSGNQVRVEGWFIDDAHKVERVEFENGTIWTADDLRRKSNLAPVAVSAVVSQAATENVPFQFVILASAFDDGDAEIGDTLGVSVVLADGNALPSWLTFDAETHTLSGTPTTGDAGNLNLKVLATDQAGASVSQDFMLTVVAATGVTLTGTAGNDVLTGTARNDTLDGAAGRDRMTGGAGNDTYYVDNTGDVIVELAGEGNDTVVSSISLTAAANVENLLLTGTANLSGTGNALDNAITGNVGSNTLNGGLGADTLTGGLGNDTCYVDNAGDVVIEFANEGTDRVISTISYTLGDNIENLTLTGAEAIDGTGNTLNNVIVCNAAANILCGLGGNDTLTGGVSNDILIGGEGNDNLSGSDGDDTLLGDDGNDTLNGGLGADTMTGGLGNDTYNLDDLADVVTEWADEGTDRVISTISYTLGDNVENLTLSGTEAIDGTGNALNNVIVGNAAANILSGLGGNDTLTGGVANDTLIGGDGNDNLSGGDGDDTLLGEDGTDTLNGGLGADTMSGGLGNDTCYVDNSGDVVIEFANEGTDRIISTISYTLGDNVENLTLSGAEAIDGTGNALNNVIVGNAAANILSGLGGNDTLTGGVSNDVLLGGEGNDSLNGGLGADVMEGSAGNDTYYVDNTGDGVIELANEGTDRVISTITYTLGDNVENLTLSGAEAINGTANALNNTLAGNVASNLLNGGDGNDSINGAAGLDFLEGMAGNDTLTDSAGNGYFNGGSGADRLTGGAVADFFLGGSGNDTLVTGDGFDVIAFNKGDGYDAITVGAGSKTASLGGGIGYNDLKLKKSGNDLVLETGIGEGMAFKNWYVGTANQNVLNLQIVVEAMTSFDAGSTDPLLSQKVQDFDFKGLSSAFDTARGATPGLTSWALSDALTQFHLAASDSAALGGDLAYQYGKNGTLAGIGLTAAQQVTGDASFGAQAQTLRPLAGLQDGTARLS